MNPTIEQLNNRNLAVGAPKTDTGVYINPLSKRYGGLTPATDTSGNTVYVGDPSINPQFKYGANTSVTESPLDKATREYYEGLSKTVDPEAIRENVRKNMQATIDAQNKYYDTLVTSQREKNSVNEARVRGINLKSGLIGSDFASKNATDIEKLGQDAISAIEEERATTLASVLSKIDERVTEEVKDARATAEKNTKEYLSYLSDKQNAVKNDVISLTKSGTSLEQIPTDYYRRMVQDSGKSETEFNAFYNSQLIANKNPADMVGTPIKSGTKLVYTIKDPTSPNGLKTVTLDTGVNVEDSKYSISSNSNGVYILDTSTGQYRMIGEPNPSPTDKKTTTIDQYTNAFSPGVRLDDGTPTLSPEGYATYDAWKAAIKEAPTKGISRADFIKTFGYLLLTQNGQIPKEYGLTPAEVRLILTAKAQTEGGA